MVTLDHLDVLISIVFKMVCHNLFLFRDYFQNQRIINDPKNKLKESVEKPKNRLAEYSVVNDVDVFSLALGFSLVFLVFGNGCRNVIGEN